MSKPSLNAIKAFLAGAFLMFATACTPTIMFDEEGDNSDSGVAVQNTNGQQAQTSSSAQGAPAGDSSSSDESKWPIYKVATLEYFPPFVMRDELRIPAGFDVEVLTAIGKEEHFNVVFIPQSWESCLPSLDTGARSIVATGVTMLPDRVAKYTFSDPYIETSYAAVMKEDPANGKPKLAQFADIFKDPNRTFVTQRGTAGEEMLKKLLNGDMSRVSLVDSQYHEIRYVTTGQADVAFDISIVLQYYIKQQNDKSLYYLIDPEAKVDTMGFALKKGNNELKAKIDAGLRKIKQNGTYDHIYEKWFGAKK